MAEEPINPFEVQQPPKPQAGMATLTPQNYGGLPQQEQSGSYFQLSPEAMQMMWAPQAQQPQVQPLTPQPQQQVPPPQPPVNPYA